MFSNVLNYIKLKSGIITLLIFLATVIFIIYGFIASRFEYLNAKKNAKYTVGYITSNWHQKNNNGVGTDFMYYVNGKKIEKTCASNLEKGTKYVVLFDSLRPRNYIMLFNHKLSDDIVAPAGGWNFKEIPLNIDSTDLKFYFDDLNL